MAKFTPAVAQKSISCDEGNSMDVWCTENRRYFRWKEDLWFVIHGVVTYELGGTGSSVMPQTLQRLRKTRQIS